MTNSAAPIGITDWVSCTGMSTVTSISPASIRRTAAPYQASSRKNPITATSRTTSAAMRPPRGSASTSPGKAMCERFSAARALP